MRQLRQAHAWSPARHLTDIADVATVRSGTPAPGTGSSAQRTASQAARIDFQVRSPAAPHRHRLRLLPQLLQRRRQVPDLLRRAVLQCPAPPLCDRRGASADRAERDRLGLPPAVCQRAARQDGPQRVGGRTDCTWSEPWLIGGAGEAIAAPAGIAGTAPGERAEAPGQIMPACAYICWGTIVCIGGQPICC